MTDRPALSRSEMEVARVLWELKSATVREVFEAIANSTSREMDFSTVQTYLRRLESKGYAKTTLKGRAKVYSPKARPATVIRETVSDFVERLFGGDAMPLMRHLIEDRNVSEEEIDQLKSLIDQLESKNQERRK